MPSLSRPIALSSPEAVSTVRGVGLPARGWNVTVLGITPPSRSSRTKPRHLADVAERPRGDQHRVLETQAAPASPEVDHGRSPPEAGRARDRPRRGSQPSSWLRREESMGTWDVRRAQVASSELCDPAQSGLKCPRCRGGLKPRLTLELGAQPSGRPGTAASGYKKHP